MCNIPSNIETNNEMTPTYNIEDYSQLLKTKLRISQQQTKQDLEKSKAKRTVFYNKKAKEIVYKPGTSVLLKNETGGKLDETYKGPFKIVQDLGPNVEIEIGKTKDIVHKSRIKHFVLQK